MTQILPADKGRADYLRVAESVSSMLGIDIKQFVSQYKFYDDTLLLLKPLSPSQSQYNFNPVRGLDQDLPSQFLMDKSDLFAVTGVGVIFTRATYASANQSLSGFGNYEEYTFPFSTVFTGSTEATGLQNIVRGALALSVNADQQWSIPVSRMVYKNQFINAQVQTISYGGSNEEQGILPLQSVVIMDGENQNTLTLNLPAGGTLTNIDGNTNATTRNIVGVKLVGFRIRNVANGGFTAGNCRV